MEIVHILTVGTSLLENSGGKHRKLSESTKATKFNQRCEETKTRAQFMTLDNLLSLHREPVLEAFHALDPAKEIAFRPPPSPDSPTDRLPQEVSYLWLHAQDHLDEFDKGGEKARCYLLASATKLGQFCAAIVQDYVNQQVVLSNRYHVVRSEPVPGVDAADSQAFEQYGFRNLMDKVHEIIQQHKTASRIYLNLTGGFKGLLPYGTLQGMIYASGQTLPGQVTLCYLFEETPSIIYMPSYPVGLNFHHWHRNATRLRMVLRGQDSFRQNLSREMQNLLVPGTPTLFSLGQHLEEEYQRQLSEDPLKVYSKEIIHKLFPDSLGEVAIKLRTILNKLVNQVGDLIWVGDKVPDMVDHALKHHQHLLEFAELFLTPILYNDPSFMNSEERFCLLAGILLHDCGHSLDYFKNESLNVLGREILLFPSDVRDYHHFLTYNRLGDPQTAKELLWPRRPGFKDLELDEDLHEAVRLVCLYHRRRTGYAKYSSPQEEAEAKNHLTGEGLPPLLERRETKSLKAKGIDLMKVVAFMRLIDGCDVQSRRAGSPQFVDQKLTILRRDYWTALRRASEALSLYRDTFASLTQPSHALIQLNQQLDPAIERSKIILDDGSVSTLFHLKDRERRAKLACLELLNEPRQSSDAKRLAQLWLIAAELVDRSDIKFKQDIHFMKHQCVKEVLVLPASIEKWKDKTNLQFDVVLVPDESLQGKYLDKPHTKGNSQTMRQLIEDEISSEYKSVEEYASLKYGLQVSYWWEKNYPGGSPFFRPS